MRIASPLRSLLLPALLALALTSCNFPSSVNPPSPTQSLESSIATPTLIATPVPPRLLTICMGQEPASLFLYGDASVAARSIRQAIYDGPQDLLGYQMAPVILEKTPSLAGGDVSLEAVPVQLGESLVDANGNLATLAEGVVFRPAGCNDASCAQTYAGREPVQMEQLAVRFKLKPGLTWSDGSPLTADDSLYSFEVAQALYPRARAELIAYTHSYLSLDELTVEWRGTPGYRNAGYASFFFTPLPRGAWGAMAPEDLLTAETSNRTPLGWGPYLIEEWTAGDHISLRLNPNYFRKGEGLPAFEKLVFRFVPDREQALAALLAGECDLLDETTGMESQASQLLEQQSAGKMAVFFEVGNAWEHADFGILPANPATPSLFATKETRQAIAMCIDRQRMADELFFGQSQVPDSYVPASHPLFNPQVRRYTFDPTAAAALFDAAGWLDGDGDPATPRTSLGITGLTDGTPLSFQYLTTTEDEKQRAAQIVNESLAQCGVQAEIVSLPWEQLFTAGPEGPVFGRNFSMAQFGWISGVEPPCFLYTTQEIPGPYPQSPKGWGGANVSGYSNPAFDLACQQALSTLPDAPEHQAAHFQAQALFAEDLPAIPLYLRLKLVATRPDMCGVILDPSSDTALWNIESFNYGEGCPK
jgi:peptide/nickel transport system substrate-binding protein